MNTFTTITALLVFSALAATSPLANAAPSRRALCTFISYKTFQKLELLETDQSQHWAKTVERQLSLISQPCLSCTRSTSCGKTATPTWCTTTGTSPTAHPRTTTTCS
ncbi:hypothetical protein GBAR_LOCUS639 [Geodia barretti]|uniref:Uncharacterized protein n=1 Tax=Geodia barretti TaxID=519541 RepID=A0AA35QU81_GEOBA|nr:hypothetical protein GBAR_LOCUS639 [Geodia barretti]